MKKFNVRCVNVGYISQVLLRVLSLSSCREITSRPLNFSVVRAVYPICHDQGPVVGVIGYIKVKPSTGLSLLYLFMVYSATRHYILSTMTASLNNKFQINLMTQSIAQII
jgi:hypothetical protein